MKTILTHVTNVISASDIKMCKNTGDLEDYNVCARKVVEKLKRHLAQGMPSLNVPPMEPANYVKIEAKRDLGLVVADAKFNNFKVRGLTTFEINDFKVDPNRLTFYMKAYIPKLSFQSQYKLDGSKILFVPLVGSGNLKLICRK